MKRSDGVKAGRVFHAHSRNFGQIRPEADYCIASMRMQGKDTVGKDTVSKDTVSKNAIRCRVRDAHASGGI